MGWGPKAIVFGELFDLKFVTNGFVAGVVLLVLKSLKRSAINIRRSMLNVRCSTFNLLMVTLTEAV